MKLHATLAVVLALPAVAAAQDAEMLMRSMPAGYHVEHEHSDGTTATTRMLPQGQSGNEWSELVTFHVFAGRKAASPERFQLALAAAWLELCHGGTAARVAQGKENGYTFSIWSQSCPLNPATGRPESTWTKAIEGNEGFYLVQKSFRFEPNDVQVRESIEYLGSVTVCDPRLPDRPCPAAAQARR